MATTVVMIHGMFAAGWAWERFAPRFEAAGYRVRTPTLRLHDVDPAEPPPSGLGGVSVLDYEADLVRHVSDLPDPPVVVGHSMGGLLAQKLAVRGLVRAAVLITPAPPSGMFALHLSTIRTFWSSLARWGFWRRPARPTFSEAVYGTLGHLPDELQRSIWERFVHESGRAACEIGFWLLDRRRASAVEPPVAPCPVLALGATEDRIVPVDVVRRAADRYRATFRELPRRSHWVLDGPGWEEVADLVLEWLTGVGAGPDEGGAGI